MEKEKRNDLKGQELPHVKQALRVWNNFQEYVITSITVLLPSAMTGIGLVIFIIGMLKMLLMVGI